MRLYLAWEYLMRILVDADACPKVIKEILFRAALRTEILLILVANKRLEIPRSPLIKMQVVAKGFDVADNEIASQWQPGDLVITSDIPLADVIIKKGGIALDFRGQLYTKDNIHQRLTVRDLMEQIRDSGIVTGGPSTLSQSDRREFSNQLDRLITKFRKSEL